MFKVGQVVVKIKGDTEFIGQIKAVYELDHGAGNWRIDVRSIVAGARKIVHIYTPKQVRLATSEELDRIRKMNDIWDEPGEVAPVM